MIPSSLLEAVRDAARGWHGDRPRIAHAEPCGGGCINRAARLHLESGETLFLKWNASAPPGMFAAEAAGLCLLHEPVAESGLPLRIPAPLAHAEHCGECPAFLLMEDLMSGDAGQSEHYTVGLTPDEILGRGLAAIHRHTSSHFGLDHDNFIGPTPQHNATRDSWASFFIELRLRPMLRHLAQRESLPSRIATMAERSLPNMARVLEAVDEPPSLLHGDLWGGNVLRTPGGLPALIDPAVYFGHREADIAMTELFGGFSRAFRSAYEAAFPLKEGFSLRRDIYNLYHILNHALLFGGGYMAQAEAIMARHA